MSDIIGFGGGKGAGEQHTHYEATDSLHSISYARVLDLISEGEILGLAHGMQSVYLNQTPIENTDGTKNFKDLTVDFRTGTQIQDYIPGFPDVENEIAVGTELRSGTPWTHAVNNLALSAIRVTLSVPALSKGDTTNGDILGYSIAYQIELSTDGGAYAIALSNSFSGKTTTPYNRSARIDLPAATVGWSIRVTRLTANANTASIADTTNIVSYTEVIDAKLRYPMSAVVGVQVDAKQFQSVPTRAYDMYGRIIQVPTNYNLVTRVYTGVWDGTFKPAWTSNPAWIFRDLVLHDRYGLGNRITAAQIDKWALYAIAQYCDQMVPNGKGGTEPRFTCNLYLQTQKQAYAVLQDLASIFRGISYWGGGSIIASSDRPMDPVYVYTAANVVGGKFSRVGSSKKTRATVALVSWNDPADFYRAKVEYVEDQEGISRYGIQQINLTAFGCTSQGQAQRAGRWALATSRLETEMISFDVGMDGAIAIPGQIVRIADPARMGRRNGGRVRTAAGRVVTLDKAPTISAGDSLTVILPSGVSETRTVSSIAGDAVTVSADWSTVPLAQSVWSVDSSTLMAPTYKILSVREKGDGLTYTITATQHEPGKFAYIENGTAVTPRPQTSLDATKQAPPSAVSIAAYTVSLNDVQKLAMSVSCPPVSGAVAYEGAYKRDSGNWIPLARQPGATFDVPDIISGTYTAKLSAVNSIGIASLETVSAPTVIAKTIDSMYNAAARLNNALVYAYQRAASAPSGTPGAVDYDFVSKVITTATLANGWQKTIPTANGNPLYVTVATASSSGTTDNIASTEWSSAVILAQDGPGGTGTNGLNTATAYIYQRGATSTAPALPSVAATYNFGATSPLTGLNNGWSATVPSTGGSYLFVSTATASSVSGSDSIPATEWAAVQLLAQDGAPGSSGTSVFVGKIYAQNATQPATPTGGTFNFGTATLTPPSGWTITQPTSSTTPTWVAQYTFSTSTAGATVTAGTWSTPVSVAQNGTAGASGTQAAIAYLYKWATSAPAAPTGTSTLTWATGANGTYTAGDGWSVTVPSNPGTPGSALYVVAVAVTAAAGATSTSVSYSGSAVQAWSLNGANGNNGSSGVQSGAAIVYQWAATIPSGPAGAATYTWSTGAFGSAPSGWALTPGTSPSPGYTLWQARVGVTDSAANTTTAFNWTSAAITAVGYAGQQGSSYVTAYCDSTTATTTTTPAATTGPTTVPAVNGGGVTGTWQSTVPTSLASGHYMWQSDGIYNPATNQISWSIPYWSYAKFGSLSAITANLGQITAGSIDIGTGTTSWHVDSSGNTWAGASSYGSAPYRVSNAGAAVFTNVTIAAGGSTILDGGGLKAGYEAPGTKNSDVVVGGNNLLRMAGQFKAGMDSSWAGGSGGTHSIDSSFTYGSFSTLKVTGDGGTDSIHILRLKPNTVYTVSAMVATDTAVASAPNNILYIQNWTSEVAETTNAHQETIQSYDTAISPSAGFRKIYATFLTPSSSQQVFMRFYFYHINAGASIWVGYAKVEEGNKATDWTPAPEDIAADTATAQAAANAANAAINDATTGLAQRLRANAATVLAGGAGLTAGTLTYDTSGNRTGGYGMAFNQRGIVGFNSSGVATITMDVSTGAVAVAGDISGSTGTFGAVTVGTSLNCGQSAYNTGNGFWAGLVSGTAKFSVGNSAGSNIRWDGSALTVSGQIIGNGNLTTGAAHTADVFSSSFTTTVPFVMPRTGTVIIKARVNPAAGDKAGFKLYNEGTVGSPGTVAATSEHYEAGLGTTAVDVWISQPLTAGNYWLGPSNASYAVLSAFVIKVLA